MKIALVILHADSRKGGAEGYTVNLAHALTARGHHVWLLATTFGPGCEGIEQVMLDSSGVTRRARYRRFVGSLDAHLSGPASYDVVHSIAPVNRCDFYHPQAGLAAEALASGPLKHTGLRRPLDRIATRLNRKRQYVVAVERNLLSSASAPVLLCVSDAVRQTARRHYPSLPESKLLTLFNAIDPGHFDPAARPEARAQIRSRFNLSDDKVVALMVAQDFKRKGVAPAIEALAGVKDDRLSLLVVGKPDPGPYRRLAERLSVAGRVVFAGPTSDTYAFYRAADCFLLPTYHDPCSLVVLEALAMGLPTITTAQNGASETMMNGMHGFVISSPDDVPALSDALRAMLDPAQRARMSEASLALRPRLSYQRHLDDLTRAYEQAMRGRTG